MDFKGDDLSFLRNMSDEEDDFEDENDLVVITLKSKEIQIHFSQLCKFSQLIREEYLISDVKNRLPHEILKFQQENKIDINNIASFFNLFKEETITITNDRYRDFYKLSRFFKTKKLIKQLKKYFNSHVTDIDFVIQLFKEEVEQNNDDNNIDFEYKSQFEQHMIHKICDCLQNDNFQKIPTSFIYKIIEKCDKNDNLSDLMIDFINKSPETLYILLRFIKLQDLSKEKFEKLLEIYSTSNKDYFQYLPCNIEYIKLLRSENEDLKDNKDNLLKENSIFKDQINQLIQDNDQLQNRIKELEKKIEKMENESNSIQDTNNILETKNNIIENENKEFQILISKLKNNEEELRTDINKYEQKFKLIQPKYDDSIQTNELFSTAFNSMLGDKTEINLIKTISNFDNLSEKGHNLASYILGLIYIKGDVTFKKDFKKAIMYFEKSFEQGNLYGLNRIGNYYFDGKEINKDYKKAIEYYQKGFELGSLASLVNLGDCYYFGKGFEQNFTKAIEFYQKAADLGNSDGLNRLGECHYYGKGFEQYFTKAIEFYQKAAEQNNSSAIFNLGLCYYIGNSFKKNYSKAIEYYSKSAELGNSRALNGSGNCYYYGEGFEQNYFKAIEYYQKSANLGNSKALYNLGDCYYYGNGFKQNYSKAIEYYQKAAELGNLDAAVKLKDLQNL